MFSSWFLSMLHIVIITIFSAAEKKEQFKTKHKKSMAVSLSCELGKHEMSIDLRESCVKQVINEGQGWESPREPYEVKVW